MSPESETQATCWDGVGRTSKQGDGCALVMDFVR